MHVVKYGSASFASSADIPTYAARGEGPLGSLSTFFSLLGLGGIWNADAVPASRSTFFVFIALVIQLVLLSIGIWRFRRSKTRHLVYMWVGAGILGLLIITFFSYPVGLHAAEWLAEHIPGTELFRDAHKWMALIMPIYAVLVSSCARAIYEFSYRHTLFGKRIDARTTTALLCVLIILLLPDAPIATGQHLQPVSYSSSWNEILKAVHDSDGDMMVLPSGHTRIFEGGNNRPVHDPAPYLVPVEVLTSNARPLEADYSTEEKTNPSDDTQEQDNSSAPQASPITPVTPVSSPSSTSTTSPPSPAHEETRADQVNQALLEGAPAETLAVLGVRWVLIEHTVAPAVPDTFEFRNALRGLEPLVTAPDLTLYRVPGTVSHSYAPTHWEWSLAFTAHVIWLLLIVVSYVAMFWLIIKDRKHANSSRTL